MATTYKFFKNRSDGTVIKCVLRTMDDGTKSAIPYDDNNKDYQDYLAWVAEGNTAEAAD